MIRGLAAWALCLGFSLTLWADVPQLPAGLGGAESSGLPELPAGLDGDAQPEVVGDGSGAQRRLNLSGFVDLRAGVRTQNDPLQRDAALMEARLQLQWDYTGAYFSTRVTADIVADDLAHDRSLKLETGSGWVDLREAYLLARPHSSVDLKLGRQILTWGTGDLLFINDLFPKDWNAFFLGRDVEYLKAPSDALKLSYFGSAFNLDIVYTPRFDADRALDPARISLFSAAHGAAIGGQDVLRLEPPDKAWHQDEWALRLYTQVRSAEMAAYAYQGYWKSPAGVDVQTGVLSFPRLRVLGASLRMPLHQGIVHAEVGHYQSLDDSAGDDPNVRNGQWRLLVGYEQELIPDFSGALQFYVERMQHYDQYRAALMSLDYSESRWRSLVTLRLTRLLMQQNLSLSFFNFYSPTDQDGYLRLSAHYKLSDDWQIELGGNHFYGERRYSFFGQFKEASNLYFALRFGF